MAPLLDSSRSFFARRTYSNNPPSVDVSIDLSCVTSRFLSSSSFPANNTICHCNNFAQRCTPGSFHLENKCSWPSATKVVRNVFVYIKFRPRQSLITTSTVTCSSKRTSFPFMAIASKGQGILFKNRRLKDSNSEQ